VRRALYPTKEPSPWPPDLARVATDRLLWRELGIRSSGADLDQMYELEIVRTQIVLDLLIKWEVAQQKIEAAKQARERAAG
jgi:hypothetical protein